MTTLSREKVLEWCRNNYCDRPRHVSDYVKNQLLDLLEIDINSGELDEKPYEQVTPY